MVMSERYAMNSPHWVFIWKKNETPTMTGPGILAFG